MNPSHPNYYYPTASPQANYELSIINYPLFYTFSAKEKDTETGYSYFGARYYESGLSVWLSVDPLSDKYPSLSSYVYCANNPVILVDPDGRSFGDFYDKRGKKIGSDGVDDGKVYHVHDKKDVKKIKTATKNNESTAVDQVKSAVEIPSYETRRELSNIITMDKENPFKEYGGLVVYNNETKKVEVLWANPGNEVNPCVEESSEIDYNTARYDSEKHSILFKFHSHGSGAKDCLNGRYSCFNQDPSPGDLQNSHQGGDYNFVFGMGDRFVRIYNEKGTRAYIKMSVFFSIGKEN